MGAEPKRWTIQGVRAARERGDRDFRNADLAGLDLRGTDLRGADLRGAILKETRLAECPLGPQPLWWLGRQGIAALTGVVGGLSIAFAGGIVADGLTQSYVSATGGLILGLFLLFFLVLPVRRGLNATSVAVAVAVAVAGAFAGTFAGAVAVAGAGAGAGVVAGAFAGAGVVAFAFAGTFAGVVAAALAAALAAAFAVDGKATNAVSIVSTIAILLPLSFYLRRRALAGDPRDAWLRTLALWLPGLGGARFAGADLTDADLSRIRARGADLRGARLVRTSFRDARELHLARFDGPLHSVPLQRLASGLPAPSANLAGNDLTGLALDGADLSGANLRGATLREARLRGARLDKARLEQADLCGADLRGAGLQGAALRGALVDIHTFLRSGWTADELAGLCERGVTVLGLEGFPGPVQVRLVGEKEGLTLYFSTRLTPFDKMLVEGVIVGVLGRDTTCHSEYRVQGESAIVRLFDAPRDDLERVAEALHRRVWERAQAEQRAIVRASEVLQPAHLREGLTDLMGRRLQRIELREAPPTPGPALLRWRWDNPAEPDANRLLGPRPCRLFLLYAPGDRELAAELVRHLTPLVRQKLIDPFDETRLLAGDVADDVLSAHLESADAVVALVSSALFQDGPWHEQLTRALARQADGVRVIPVRVRAVSWEGTELARLQPLPDEGPPVMGWPDRDQAWECVVSGLRRALLNQARG